MDKFAGMHMPLSGVTLGGGNLAVPKPKEALSVELERLFDCAGRLARDVGQLANDITGPDVLGNFAASNSASGDAVAKKPWADDVGDSARTLLSSVAQAQNNLRRIRIALGLLTDEVGG